VAALSTIDVAARLLDVRARIEQAGGDTGAVTVVAMTKGFGFDAVQAAASAGIVDFGENYVDELLAKRDGVHRWHFLGRIQRRDVRRAEGVALWQTVDRAAAGEEIAKRWPGAAVMVQVNTSGEAQKQGCPPADTAALVDRLRGLGLDVRGLMTIGPIGAPEEARPCFRALAELGRRLELRDLSMGMTDDLEVAVQEGSTMVRVGRALFGPRPDRPQARR
jgi:pyridoxal phosphate enzyme (YggS family)